MGKTNRANITKIDNMIIKMAKQILGKQASGRTNEWILRKIGWLNFDDTYKLSILKTAHQIMNTNNNHFIKSELIRNRNVRNASQNKTGPNPKRFGINELEQQTFIFQVKKVYNQLPRELTLIKNPNIFKTRIKKHIKIETIQSRKVEDDKHPEIPDEVNILLIDQCSKD